MKTATIYGSEIKVNDKIKLNEDLTVTVRSLFDYEFDGDTHYDVSVEEFGGTQLTYGEYSSLTVLRESTVAVELTYAELDELCVKTVCDSNTLYEKLNDARNDDAFRTERGF